MIAILLLLLAGTLITASLILVLCYRGYCAEYEERALLKAHNQQLLADYMAQIETTRQLTAQRDELLMLCQEASNELTQLRERHEGLRQAYTLESDRRGALWAPTGLPRVIQFLYPN